MKLIRKIGFFLLIICAINSQTVIANEDVSDISYKAEVLQSMNIIDKSKKDADETITRSQLANALAMMVNDTLPESFELADLTEADGGMYWLYNANAIVGNGDGLLRPTAEITLSEAVKMTLSVMGYDYAAETAGGYPGGYMKVARDCRILDDIRISASDILTYDNFITMLYNVIDAEILVYDIADRGYKQLLNETLLSYYGEIKKLRDIMPGMAISVERNASSYGDYYKLIIHKNTVLETVIGISSEEAETSEGKYKLTGRCNELISDADITVNLGDVYKIYLTEDHRIIYFEKMADDEMFAERIGYLEKITPIDELIDNEFIVKIYDQDGMWVKLRLAKKVRIDDENKKAIIAAEAIEEKLGGLIKFRMNIKGELEEICFPAPLPDGKTATKFNKNFQLLLDSTGAYYKYYPSSYTVGVGEGPILQVTSDCKVFVKSANTNAEDSIGVVLPRGFLSDGATKYDMEAYSTKGEPGFADVLFVIIISIM